MALARQQRNNSRASQSAAASASAAAAFGAAFGARTRFDPLPSLTDSEDDEHEADAHMKETGENADAAAAGDAGRERDDDERDIGGGCEPKHAHP